MNTDQRLLYVRAFENAKWILTDKKSGDISEHNYSEMSEIVRDAYKKEKGTPQDVIIKYLSAFGCEIYRIDDRFGESVNYSEILPDYTIDCYNWHYLCQNCLALLDEIREKGQEAAKKIFCRHCFQCF